MYKIFIVLFIFVLNNCSSINTEPKYAIESFDQNAPKILLMPIDIEICEITLAGMCEPNAIWTENSKKNIIVGFEEILKERNAIMNKFDKTLSSIKMTQLVKLHNQVGHEIISNEYGQLKLPTKKNFDWTIGRKANLLKTKYNSDYAIFIFFRDQYSSGERKIYSILTAVLFPGVIPIGGTQIAFASLVDLKTGKIMWFNGFYRSFGDVRDLEGAKETLNVIFEKFPR